MAAPTLVSYGQTAWNTTTTPKTVAVSWQTGDILVFIGASESAGATAVPAVPTVAGLTFSSVQSNSAAGSCGSRLATATAAGTSSGSVSSSLAVTALWGFGVWVWRSSTGVGNSIEQHTATKTKALTLAGTTNSGICVGVFDFNADAAGSGTPAVSNTRQAAQDALHYTQLVFDHIDYSTSGSSWGQTGGGSTGPFSILAIEIKNDGAGGATNWGPWMVDDLRWNRLVQ